MALKPSLNVGRTVLTGGLLMPAGTRPEEEARCRDQAARWVSRTIWGARRSRPCARAGTAPLPGARVERLMKRHAG